MKVLSIDFDWVMEPCIEVYNDFACGRNIIGAAGTWDEIQKKIPAIHSLNLEMDYTKYQELYNLILQVIHDNPNLKIAIRLTHDEIVPIILSLFQNTEYNLSIINIDHHHDLGYANDSYQQCGCANWVAYLSRSKQIPQLSYQWIHNLNSEMRYNESIPSTLMQQNSTQLININTTNIDLLFLCASWEWVPLKYGPLFEILHQTICEKGMEIL